VINFIMRTGIVAAAFVAAFFAPGSPRVCARASGFAAALQGAPASEASSANQAPALPSSPKEREELQARIFMARKDYQQAENVYAKLAAEYPREPSYLNAIGIAKQQQDDLKGAAVYYQRATKVDKKFATGYSNLGTTWYALKQYGRAIRFYQRAISVEPQVAGFYSNLGYAYFAEKKFPQAFTAFQKAMAISPDIFQQSDRNGSVMSYQSVADRGLFDFMMAKSYAQKADAMNCAAYLRKAHDEGYKATDKLLADHAFDMVRADPDVKTAIDLLLPPPPQKSAESAPSGA
jgi:tetratricopeptide (TPR) repeat protein